MSGAITQAVYMGVGASGAMTNVSSYVDLIAGISYDYGRDSEFDDTNPGTFSFTLDNPDGRFTPENTASAYATTVTEGMQVCWQAGARLVAGSIIGIQPAFPGDDAAWAQVVITCDDMLGDLARTQLSGSLADDMVQAATPYAYWPMSNTDGASAIEALSEGQPNLSPDYTGFPVATFGRPGLAGSTTTQARFTGDSTTSLYSLESGVDSLRTDISYPSGSMGAWGFWITPDIFTATSSAFWFYADLEYDAVGVDFSTNSAGIQGRIGNSTFLNLPTTVPGTTYYVGVVVTNTATTATADFYLDGVLVGSKTATGLTITTSAHKQLRQVEVRHQDDASASTGFFLYGLSHTQDLVDGATAIIATESARAVAVVATATAAAMAAPSGLSSAPIALENPSGSALDALNEVVKAEQGALYSTTSGTVSSPTETLVFRARDRPTTPTESFDAEDEGSGSPEITRDITNLLSAVTVTGPEAGVRVRDVDLFSRTTATGSETSILADELDLMDWGWDRLIRGANTQLRVQTFPIDTFTTPTDRSADILALVPGDRVEITDLPSTVLGFSTWEGWLLGAHEEHGIGRHLFELRLQPVLDDPAIFDTGRFMSDGEITLNAGINAAVTSIVYATTGSEMEATAVPYAIVIDSEQMNVTAVNTGTNTLTVTRGYNSTTAATHSAAAPIELVDEALFAF